MTCQARGRHDGAFAHGVDGRDARRPDRGDDARDERDRDADAEREHDGARRHDRARLGQPEAEQAEDGAQAVGEQVAQRRGRSATRATPITNVSSTTERMIWRRDAPMVRSVANSRVRCATVIESVLKMTKAPTKRAMPPKPSSA